MHVLKLPRIAAAVLVTGAPCWVAGPAAVQAADLAVPGAAGILPGRRAAAEDAALQRLYTQHPGPLWSADGRPTRQAQALLALLAGAADFGLDPEDYGPGPIDAARRLGGGADPGRFDLLLSRAAVRFLTHLHYGRVDPAAAGFELPARPADLDAAAAVAALAAAADVSAAAAAFEPHFSHYALLKAALPRYRAAAATDSAAPAEVRKIELTLERWRWLPPLTAPPIIVNIPQFQLFAFHTTEDRRADIDQMHVIVGKSYPRHRTPVFAGTLRYVIFRPYWDVPRSIAVGEILPQVHARPGYLARNHYELVDGDRDDSPVVPATAENLALLAAGKLRVRQQPGQDNALGLVKLMFPNRYNVYLHSTPAQSLFSRSRRDFSHGCIRVEDPVALAAYALRNNPGWDRGRVLAAMNGSRTLRVDLAQPIPVMILYGTALATEAGPVEFYDDLYGNDARLEKLLGLSRVAMTGGKMRTEFAIRRSLDTAIQIPPALLAHAFYETAVDRKP